MRVGSAFSFHLFSIFAHALLFKVILFSRYNCTTLEFQVIDDGRSYCFKHFPFMHSKLDKFDQIGVLTVYLIVKYSWKVVKAKFSSLVV